jgi:hypothetical protein
LEVYCHTRYGIANIIVVNRTTKWKPPEYAMVVILVLIGLLTNYLPIFHLARTFCEKMFDD